MEAIMGSEPFGAKKLLMTLVVAAAVSYEADAYAQNLVQPPAPQSPHWTHINLFDYGRSLYLGNASMETYQWYTSRFDALEVQGNEATLLSLNPTMKFTSYHLDLTGFVNGGTTSTTGLPENVFLHFSETTQLKFYTLDLSQVVGTATIPGCPEGTAMTSACRVQTHMWSDRRYIFNTNSSAFRTWKTTQLLGSINEYGFNTGKSTIVWIDEHAPGFSWPHSFGYQTVIMSGGGIREFGGLRPGSDSLEQSYSDAVASWLTYLAGQAKMTGKKVLINANANALHPWLLPQVKAINGMSTESKHRPDGYDGPEEYGQYVDLIKSLTAAGGVVDLHGIWCYSGPSGYTAGNYGSPLARYHMWRLAAYYQFKEPIGSPGIVYFNPAFCSNETAYSISLNRDQTDWLAAYQVNVGQPNGDTTVYSSGTAGCAYQIFSRKYTNALILVRPQDSSSCTNYGDSTAATVTFAEPVRILREDGTLGPPVSTVKLRNAEAVILYGSTPPASPRNLRVN
jgi:hypothetical protein